MSPVPETQPDLQRSEPTGDAAVDRVIAKAAAAVNLATSEHNTLYMRLVDELQHELDTDPATAMNGGDRP